MSLGGRLLRDVYVYECKLWDYPQPCGRGHGVAAMMDRAASERYACGVSLAWLLNGLVYLLAT